MKPSITAIALFFVTLVSPSTEAFTPSSVLKKLPISGARGVDTSTSSSNSFHLVGSSSRDKDTTSTSLFAKKILLSFDGTGNNPENFIPNPDEGENKFFTNVLRLHLLAGGALDDDINKRINDNRTDGQICLYQRGIGGEKNKGDNKVEEAIEEIRKKKEFALGVLEEETKPMLKQLEEVYEMGDKLYLIGFSRGSAAARKFAVDLAKNGLKPKDKKENVNIDSIEFLGCFDTVSMQVKDNFWKIIFNEWFTKRPTKSTVLGEDGHIPKIVKKAVHNVSLDDGRQFRPLAAYPPVLMGAADNVHETWFSGAHGNIGGNFFKRGLADCSLEYMKEWMESLGENSLKFIDPKDINEECLQMKKDGKEKKGDLAKIDGNWKVVKKDLLALNPIPTDEIHIDNDALNNFGMQKRRPSYRLVHVLSNDKIVPDATVNIHESVLHRMKAMQEDKDLNQGPPINKNLKKMWKNVKVVGSLGKELDGGETETLQELLQSDDI